MALPGIRPPQPPSINPPIPHPAPPSTSPPPSVVGKNGREITSGRGVATSEGVQKQQVPANQALRSSGSAIQASQNKSSSVKTNHNLSYLSKAAAGMTHKEIQDGLNKCRASKSNLGRNLYVAALIALTIAAVVFTAGAAVGFAAIGAAITATAIQLEEPL